MNINEKNVTTIFNMKYVFATFCFGERYYKQTNRLIESLESKNNKNDLFVITDNENEIKKLPWVKVKNINEYNSSYLNYAKNYFDFDFSVKRYSLRFALENNNTKVILIDTDVIVGSNFSEDKINTAFVDNSIVGPVVYEYQKEILTNSMLGERFNHYERVFGVNLNKKDLWMPEDCIQFLDMKTDKFNKFLDTWDECIKIKYNNNLPNVPAGNIDEMCFSALLNDISVGNNSNKTVNILTANHDIWYR